MRFFRKTAKPKDAPPVVIPMLKEWISLTEEQRLELAAPAEVPVKTGDSPTEKGRAQESDSSGEIIPFDKYQAQAKNSVLYAPDQFFARG